MSKVVHLWAHVINDEPDLFLICGPPERNIVYMRLVKETPLSPAPETINID